MLVQSYDVSLNRGTMQLIRVKPTP